MNEKQKNLVIAVVIVVTLFASLYLSSRDNEELISDSGIDLVIPDQNIDENNEEIVNENKDEFNLFDKVKFDSIMQKGSDAFNDKNYQLAIDYYRQALAMEDLAVIHAKMFSTYKFMGDMEQAMVSLEKARNLDPSFNQYWFWTIEEARDYEKKSFSELDILYKEAYGKVESSARVNLVLFFARVAEGMKESQRAIELWQNAQKERPNNYDLYQAEIDRLQNLL